MTTITYAVSSDGSYIRWVTPRSKPVVSGVMPGDEDYADAVIAVWSEKTEQEQRVEYGMWRGYKCHREIEIVTRAGLLPTEWVW